MQSACLSTKAQLKPHSINLNRLEPPLHKVSVVAKTAPQDSQIQSENKFKRHETIQELEHGAIDGGVLGGMTGILIGLTTLFIPGVGAVAFLGAKAALVGALVGTYYGGVAGMILGAAFGQGISTKQARFSVPIALSAIGFYSRVGNV